MDETELIAAARSGDEDAFAELYRQHLGYVKAVGRVILRKNDVEDMCQDTFLRAFTRLHSFEGNSQFRTWITRIAVNQCLVSLRKGRRTNSEESNLTDIDARFARGDRDLEGVPLRLDLEKLLRKLTRLQRRALEMAYVEDMPAQEIAEILGKSVACVKNSIHHAKLRAREIHQKR
jgi:RNA polymerase sigma-70 factor (ECF subfamily)